MQVKHNHITGLAKIVKIRLSFAKCDMSLKEKNMI